MPVRFVCPSCEQLLQVASRKTGSEVKCPKCSKPITVPTEAEGEVQVAARKAAPKGVDDPFAEFMVYDDSEVVYDTADAAPSQPVVEEVPVDYDKVAVPRNVLYAQGVLLGVVALAAFTLGLLFGGPPRGSGDGEEQDRPCRIEGQLDFVDKDGEEIPDQGAVVIVLPAEVRPDEKFPIEGLRPEEEAPGDDDETVLGIHQLGGAYTRADEQGKYGVEVPGPGVYFALFLSSGAQRLKDAQPEGIDLAQLGRYFLPADELLGRNRYFWSEQRVKKDVRRDYTFERPGP